MPKATWSQSSERYYQQRLKLHLINWLIFRSDCVSEDIQENLHSLANCILTSQRYQMSCQLSHHMIPLDITFIQVSSFSSFPCMTIGSQQTWMDDGLDLDTSATESLHSKNDVCLCLKTSYFIPTWKPTLPHYVPTYELTLPSYKPALSLPTSKPGIHPQRIAMNKPVSKGNE